MANPLYVPLNVDIGDTSGKLTVPWRQFFQALNGTMGPVATAITQLTGDVTAGPGPGSVAATIANDAVTYAKMQNVSAASRLLGRGSAAGAGNVEEITVSTGLTMTGTTLTATGSGGTVTNTGTLTDHAVIVGNGGVDVSALASLGTTTTVLHGNASGDPRFGAVSLTADVSGVLPFANGGAEIPIHWAFVTSITNAQFLTLPSTFIEVVAAPGSGKTLVPQWAMIHLDITGAYTNVSALTSSGLTIAYGDNVADGFTFSLFQGTTRRDMLMPQHLVPDATILLNEYPDYSDVTLPENLPFKLVAMNPAGDYTGGNVANTFRIGVAYSILNYSTGVFS